MKPIALAELRRHVKGGLFSVSAFALLAMTVAGTAIADEPSVAQVQWKNGPRVVPQRMQPVELDRALVELAARPGDRRAVLHLDGPLSKAGRAELDASGVRLLGYVGSNAYFVTLTDQLKPARAAAIAGVVAVEPIDPATKLHPDLAGDIVHPWTVVEDRKADDSETVPVSPIVAVNVLFHRDVGLDDEAVRVVRRFGGSIHSRMRSINGVVAHVSMDRVEALAASDSVMFVEPPLPLLTELNDSNRTRVGADVVSRAPYDLDGSGVTVMVYDGGQVFSHGDLAGRLTLGDTTSTSDHATHVACTIAGSGSGSPIYQGMAPAADVVSYGFEIAGGLGEGFLYTDPGDIEADYSEAIAQFGADLSNNSIGSNVSQNGFPCSWEGNYGATGALIDEIVRGSLGNPFRIVWANGNERGTGFCGTQYLTTPPPACAKNSLTVGALNSNDDSVTSFTSWGPCDDGRLKPDVAAPGCQSGGDGGVTSCSSSGGYNAKCGTSMASPTAAGVSTLLLQQYRDSYPTRPDFRNSLLRALLAHTAHDLGNPGPDYQTGYGSIRVKPAADVIIAENFQEREIAQGEVFAFVVEVPPLNPKLKVTLAWDDPAGVPNVDPALVNDLDLRVIDPQGGVHYPWTLDPANPGENAVQTVKDATNNIEQVVIFAPQAGTYRVEVEGFHIAQGPEQPYSVVATPTLTVCADEPTFSGLQTIAPGSSCGEIDLSWGEGQSNCIGGQISYNVYRSTQSGFTPSAATLVQQGVTATSTTDSALAPGVTYSYVVRADDSNSSEEENTVELSAASPTAPDLAAPIFAGLASLEPGGSCGEIMLSWEAAVESCSLPTLYEVHRSTNPLFTPGPDTLVGMTYGTGFVDTSIPPGTQHVYIVRASDSLGNQEGNSARMSATPTVFDLEVFSTAFEPDDAGWTLGTPNDAETGTWEWGDPEATSYQSGDDATAIGVNCWVTQISGTPSNGDIDGGTTTLVSAQYDMTGMVNPTVNYNRWFTNDRGNSPGDATDTFRIDVSGDDGQNWTAFEEVGAGTPLAWVPVQLPLPIAGTSEMRFRFTAADLGEGSVVEAGIDDFQIVDAGQACVQCGTQPVQSLCSITVDREGDDIRVDWSGNLVATRAVVYRVDGCGESQRIKLGSVVGNSFLHENAALAADAFNYRVTFVDECGDELAFCGASDCP